jgi:hypothetical protein
MTHVKIQLLNAKRLQRDGTSHYDLDLDLLPLELANSIQASNHWGQQQQSNYLDIGPAATVCTLRCTVLKTEARTY